ncbi:hypothetical protein PENSPDRAFT_754332 [Peniophora sp. CONT]|nr:hypothetical protein PENSPDRAFT_754332 [Peniophora sp. CONT]
MPDTTSFDSPNILSRLPAWASRWLGYRSSSELDLPAWNNNIWSWIGAFCELSVIAAIFGHTVYFTSRNVPVILPSFGASAAFIYGNHDAPSSQPRALVGGHFLGALIGVCTMKLFHMASNFEDLRWLASGISCATTIVLMELTHTMHPPAGATAIIPIVTVQATALGWYYLPVVLLSSILSLSVALLVNNVQRRYPAFWLTPRPGQLLPLHRGLGDAGVEKQKDSM